MTNNLFAIVNVKQMRTGGSFRILLPFFQTFWGVGVLNSTIFNGFHNQVKFDTILEGLGNFGGGEGLNLPNHPSVRHCLGKWLCALNEFKALHLSQFLFFFLFWKLFFSSERMDSNCDTVITFVKMHVEAASKCVLRNSGTMWRLNSSINNFHCVYLAWVKYAQ